MATGLYHDWVAAGRPWKLAKPVEQLEAWAERNGVKVLGTIGDTAHLTADWPQDHTPFSASAWPVPLSGYIVTAIDLANVRGIGPQILTDARAGRLPWLKYLIFSQRLYSHSDGFETGHKNSDDHIHISIRSDHVNTDIAGYDPLGVEVQITELIQQAVKDAGLDPGPIDGIPGPQTLKGLTAALKAREGPRGPKGPEGDPGPPGKTPTQVQISLNGRVTESK